MSGGWRADDPNNPDNWDEEDRANGWHDLAKNPDPSGGLMDQAVAGLNRLNDTN